MRSVMIILLGLVAAPLPAQQVSDRFLAGSRSESTPRVDAPERPSPITMPKVVGAVAGTLVGARVGGEASYILSAGDGNATVFGALVGAAVGAGLGAYIPGDSPPHAAPATFAMAAVGTIVAASFILVFPPLVWAGPPAGALIGFSMAY